MGNSGHFFIIQDGRHGRYDFQHFFPKYFLYAIMNYFLYFYCWKKYSMDHSLSNQLGYSMGNIFKIQDGHHGGYDFQHCFLEVGVRFYRMMNYIFYTFIIEMCSMDHPELIKVSFTMGNFEHFSESKTMAVIDMIFSAYFLFINIYL